MIDYKKYPKDWKTKIRPDILKRAEDKCEFCGVENYEIGYRNNAGDFTPTSDVQIFNEAGFDEEFSEKLIKIVLTIAHLDHDIKNNDYSNLKALCQRCHLNYDKEHHKKNSSKTRRNKKNIYELFNEDKAE